MASGDVIQAATKAWWDWCDVARELERDLLGAEQSPEWPDCHESQQHAQLRSVPVDDAASLIRTSSQKQMCFSTKAASAPKTAVSDFQINFSESSRLSDEKDSAQRDSQMFRQKDEDEKKKSDRWKRCTTLPNSPSVFYF